MTSIPMPEFSRDSDAVILKVRQGETVVLTENGQPVAQISPVTQNVPATPGSDLLWMCKLGEKWISDTPESREALTNEDIDRIVYEH